MSAQTGISAKAAKVQDTEEIRKSEEKSCEPCSMHRFKAYPALHG